MMLELTAEQRRVVEGQGGRPVEVVDPATRRAYVLIPREEFERVRPLLDDAPPAANPPEAPSFEIPPGIRRSQEAFWRELPELLKQRKLRKRWVCYHGDERVGIAKSATELVQECLRRGIKRTEFYVGWIEPRPVPPWEPEVIEESLFEFTDEAQTLPPAAP